MHKSGANWMCRRGIVWPCVGVGVVSSGSGVACVFEGYFRGFFVWGADDDVGSKVDFLLRFYSAGDGVRRMLLDRTLMVIWFDDFAGTSFVYIVTYNILDIRRSFKVCNAIWL